MPMCSPGSKSEISNAVATKVFDLKRVKREQLARDLQDVDAVVSALNGPALEAQAIIQYAAADAGVSRFYRSESGFHHIYRKPNDPMGYIHPAWDLKAQ